MCETTDPSCEAASAADLITPSPRVGGLHHGETDGGILLGDPAKIHSLLRPQRVLDKLQRVFDQGADWIEGLATSRKTYINRLRQTDGRNDPGRDEVCESRVGGAWYGNHPSPAAAVVHPSPPSVFFALILSVRPSSINNSVPGGVERDANAPRHLPRMRQIASEFSRVKQVN